MRIVFSVFVLSFLISAGAMAEKPEWTGKGKPTAEQKEAHKAAMKAKEEAGEKRDIAEKEEKLKKDKDSKEREKHEAKNKQKDDKEVKGLDKQREKKSTQEQKELGKGSDTGQEASSTRKKWWKFWE